ncbi:hypothetical protein ACHAPT_004733 [Fusarium lateritium]
MEESDVSLSSQGSEPDMSFSPEGSEPGKHTNPLEWLIPIAYDCQQAEYAQRRHPGTAQWFLDSEPYQKWIHAASDLGVDEQTQDLRTLFCPGPAGAGKSVLTSAVIHDLGCRFPRGSDSTVGIAYIYCIHDHRREQSAANLLLVLLEQLLPEGHRLQPRIRLPYHAPEDCDSFIPPPPSLVTIIWSLEESIAKYDRLFFVIDALDECAHDDRTMFLKEIFRLQTKHPIHLFATSDPSANVAHMFANTASLEIQAGRDDVRSYMECRMDDLPHFVKEKPTLREEIKDVIAKAAPGSFLVPVLQLQSLAVMPSTQDIRSALAGMAGDPASDRHDALYEAATRRIENQAPAQVDLAKRTLSYILCARCPWTASELCHALAVKVGDTELDCNAMPSISTINTAVAACSGMIVTIGGEYRDPEDKADVNCYAIMVRLVHRTAYEYLERTRERWLPEAAKQMATTCTAYLSLSYFSGGSCHLKHKLEVQLQVFSLYYYAALHWEFHARAAFDKFQDMRNIDFEFLRSSAHIDVFCDVVFRAGQWPSHEDSFWCYARSMNGLHLAGYLGMPSLVRALGGRAGVTINARDRLGNTALAWAVEREHEETVKAMLELAAIDIDLRDNRGQTPISLAAEHNHAAIVRMLLDHDANPNLKDFRQATPLWHAAKGGHIAAVALLVGCSADINAASEVITYSRVIVPYGEIHTPLSVAVMDGQDEVVRLLLAQPSIQPQTKVKTKGHNFCTPLRLAMLGGHVKIAEMILSHPDVATAVRMGQDGEMLLHLAIYLGRENMVRLLLRDHFDINAQCEEGNTPLHVALNQGRDGFARLLLAQANVRLDLANKRGETAASSAVHGGLIQILRSLLAKGVDTEARTEGGLTLLSVAVQQGYMPIVELLLAMDGVDAESRDVGGRTPLALAARPSRQPQDWHINPRCVSNHYGVMKCLLDSGRVHINSRDESGQTPLILSAGARDVDSPTFTLLLDHKGVDINAVDGKGHTALAWAARMQEQDKAILLLRKGADPNLGTFNDNETLLSLAVKGSMLELTRALISHDGVDAQARNGGGHTALCEAVESSEVDLGVVEAVMEAGGVDINARCGDGQTLLHHVARRASGGGKVASLLLAKGNADVDAQDGRGRTPLHYAAECASEEVVSMLLDTGITDASCRDREGRSPLSLAAEYGHLGVVEVLLSLKGVIPDVMDNTGRTPLSWAVQARPEDASAVVKRLLGVENVDPDAEDEKGWTALFWAIQGKEVSDMIETLLREGAGRIDINREDREGRTPLALALTRGHEVIVGQLRAAGASEKRQNSHGDSLGGVELEGPPRKRARRGWLSPSWFEDPADDSGNNSDWSGTSQVFDGEGSRVIEIESQIKLGVQDQTAGDDEGMQEEELCPQCKALDLNHIFSHPPPHNTDGRSVIINLGQVSKSWESRPCAMCRLIAAICPQDTRPCSLCAYSSTNMWLWKRETVPSQSFLPNWVDTVVLGVHNLFCMPSFRPAEVSSAILKCMPHGFICRIGSNDDRRLRSLTIHRLQADQADFGRARGWIDCCAAHHGGRCNPSTRRSVTSFRLIDCATRDVVDGQSFMNEFVALSYVWSFSAPEPATVDCSHVDKAERVVEDAIRTTRALGYKYLWVDRHCISNEDQEGRRKQLQEMNAVYENAQLTIVAAAGEDSAFGLPGGHALEIVPLEPACIIRHSVWWTRGWTFQEGLLSRRRLFFTEHEMSFECRGLVAREIVELPIRIHRIAATRHPILEHERTFSRPDRGSYGSQRFSIWSHISEYTERRLTNDYDILNAMLGIMQVAAERDPPIHHLCGVPVVSERDPMAPDNTRAPTLLEAFAHGFCWESSSTRREGFPSWSWIGWRGKVQRPRGYAVSFNSRFAIEVSMVPQDDPSQPVSWAEFEAMGPKEKAGLPQDCILEITADAVQVDIRFTGTDSILETIMHAGHDVFEGSVMLCKDPEKDTAFRRRLAEERFTAIVIGNKIVIQDIDHYAYEPHENQNHLVLLLLDAVGEYWERIGVIHMKAEQVLDLEAGVVTQQVFRVN